jgi:hypothetical protein
MQDPTFCLTFDVDWAPSFIIKEMVDMLENFKLPATFFLTHPLDFELPSHIEAAAHPNFLRGSTHGKTEEAVIDHVLEQLPPFIGVRTHGLYWNSRLDEKLYAAGCRYDSSLFLPLYANITSFVEQHLVRIPFFWGDGYAMRNKIPFDPTLIPNILTSKLKVFQFHPIYVFLNSESQSHFSSFKSSFIDLKTASRKQLEPFRLPNIEGVGVFFERLCNWLVCEQHRVIALREIPEIKKDTSSC